jgi:hypothetical protein
MTTESVSVLACGCIVERVVLTTPVLVNGELHNTYEDTFLCDEHKFEVDIPSGI